ncbi:3-hydroxyacyl-ACP dehydratase FabZ family protein [Actinosynnema sp. NPDC020468]|uniref:3-hydroxyacyl-ACP dehydratase FabZ family protein n=1 Tax=Actinosynnema sp. NPDC020468 TaxID=3154488 RepID=UPI00340DE7D8
MTAPAVLAAGDRAAPLRVVGPVSAVETESGWWITARVPITADDPHTAAHFPGAPVFPGVFLIEGVGQAVAGGTGLPTRTTAVERARFTAPVVPGDVVRFDVVVTTTGSGWAVRADVVREADGTPVAQVRLRLEAEVA